MSVERGTAASHNTHAASQRHGGGKTAGQAAASGDFLALMAAVEDGLGALEGDALAPLQGEAKSAGKRGRAEADADAVPFDPAAAGALVLPVPLPAAEAALRKAAHVAPEAATSAAAVPGEAAGAAGAVGADAAGAAAGSAGPAGASADPRLAPEYASVFEQLQKHLAARESAAPESALKSAATATNTSMAQALQAGDLREARESRAERSVAALSAAAARTESMTVAAPQELAVAAADRARGGGQDAAGGGTGHHGSAQGGWSGAEFTPTVQYDAALGGLDASAALQPDTAFDRQLADQLRHWASQGVRSAELTVGTTEPVQVRIALDGNEAQVQFRAEHAATRDMLAGSVEQLRDLLGAQGLVLSGVSVGAHDTGGRRGQAGEGPAGRNPPPRQAPAAPVAAVAEAAPRRGTGALDLYV
ncbi:flagellar hook-length control protein FliK [Pseudorhodoferax sp. Leaf274]|uniref:flagellar hook-length control protein FliK n=1 Tax=Pseudorhodoferax sp. Leaf274 TaxID=1736318 RepID=UPI000703A6DF|nr:flagellar hook-length control protein FliK [Pseudorhodoferax sp. Leaf274]KQP44996.1 hypothetical protein ASF44_26275 [Pseudorhodoferax sp. Leaf274]